MKPYSSPFFVLAILFFCVSSCGQAGESGRNDRASEGDGAYTKLSTYDPAQQDQAGTIVMKELRDPQTGRVNMYMPFPADWRVTENAILGPGGTTLQELPGGSFNGQQRYIRSIDDIIQQDIQQLIQQNGGQYVGTIDLPKVAQRDERLGMQYWQAMPMEKIYQAKGVEVRDANGRPGILVVHYSQSRNQYGSYHYYYLHAMTSSEGRYEADREILLFALANQQSNPEAVQAFNRKMQEEYMRRERMHAAKMKQAWDHFNAWNRNHVETWQDINESSMASWRRREAMRDAGQANAIDGILERERLVSPFDGKELEVDAGYKYYYTNAFGEVIGSNDEFFNPQTDPNLNNQEWRRADVGN
jgi:hypothetical protein